MRFGFVGCRDSVRYRSWSIVWVGLSLRSIAGLTLGNSSGSEWLCSFATALLLTGPHRGDFHHPGCVACAWPGHWAKGRASGRGSGRIDDAQILGLSDGFSIALGLSHLLFQSMPHFVAFLRGINLGKRRIKMDDLQSHFETLGFTDVSTFIASGNVLFTTKSRTVDKLAKRIESHLEQELGYSVPTLIRTQNEITDLVAQAPLGELFSDGPKPSTQVTFFSEALPDATAKALVNFRSSTDAFAIVGRELYWRCATRISESTVWKDPAINPHHIPTGTTRNLNTLQKLVARFAP